MVRWQPLIKEKLGVEGLSVRDHQLPKHTGQNTPYRGVFFSVGTFIDEPGNSFGSGVGPP